MRLLKRVIAGIVVMFFILSANRASAEPCPPSAQAFWRQFRQAVIAGNVSAITKHVKFPLSVRGTLDSSKTRMLGVDEFKAAFPELLSTDPGLSAEPSTMKELVSKTRTLGRRNCNPQRKEFSVGTWQFQHTPKGWLLSSAYTED